MQVIKRDCTNAEFDATKISNAIFKAFKSVHGSWKDEFIIEDITRAVVETIEDNYTLSDITFYPKVIGIENLVINTLEEHEYLDEARAYQNYRQMKTEVRGSPNPDKSAIGNYIIHSKYLSKGDASWISTIHRLQAMYIKRLPSLEQQIKNNFTYIFDKRVMPSMRSVQFAGLPIEVNNARMYNCSYSPITRKGFFSEMFFLLLSGCGVGYSVQDRHINILPEIEDPDTGNVIHHHIKDSIEGWGDAVKCLFESYMPKKYQSFFMEFDYSAIRYEGAELKTSGGKAPGHIPLKIALERIRQILQQNVGRKLDSFTCHRICCILAEAVLAGGIRRSSLICLFDPFDSVMMNCKTGDWDKQYPELAMSNNSAVNPNKEQMKNIFSACSKFGEPGYVFLTNPMDEGINPCGEILMNAKLGEVVDRPKGENFGFSFCNLTEINFATVINEEDFLARCRAASFIGTLQAVFSDIPYVRNTAKRDALLGVSLTGVVDNIEMLKSDMLTKGVRTIKEMNRGTAISLGINPAKRLTTIKPSGTTSLLLGAVGSGMHYHHSKRYIRRVTAKSNEPSFIAYRKANPNACIEKANGDWVVEFPILADGPTREDVSALEIYDMQCFLSKHWVDDGNNICNSHHNVSCTVDVKEEEWEEVEKEVFNQKYTSNCVSREGKLIRANFLSSNAWNSASPRATSFMPYSGDTIYPFAPREDISSIKSMLRWMELNKTYVEPDYTDVSSSDRGSACEGANCEL